MKRIILGGLVALAVIIGCSSDDSNPTVYNLSGSYADTSIVVGSDSRLVVDTQLLIASDASLTIRSGCTIEMENNAFLQVSGTLEILGSADHPVRVKSRDGTRWLIVLFGEHNGVHRIEYTDFDGAETALKIARDSVCVSNSTFRNNRLGVELTECQGGYIEDCDFQQNLQALFSLESDSVAVEGCSFSNNTSDPNEASVQLTLSRLSFRNCTFSGEGLTMLLSDHDRSELQNCRLTDCQRGLRYLGSSRTKLSSVEFDTIERAIQIVQWQRDSLNIDQANFISCPVTFEYLDAALIYSHPMEIDLGGLYYENDAGLMDSAQVAASIIDAYDLPAHVDTLKFTPLATQRWNIDTR